MSNEVNTAEATIRSIRRNRWWNRGARTVFGASLAALGQEVLGRGVEGLQEGKIAGGVCMIVIGHTTTLVGAAIVVDTVATAVAEEVIEMKNDLFVEAIVQGLR